MSCYYCYFFSKFKGTNTIWYECVHKLFCFFYFEEQHGNFNLIYEYMKILNINRQFMFVVVLLSNLYTIGIRNQFTLSKFLSLCFAIAEYNFVECIDILFSKYSLVLTIRIVLEPQCENMYFLYYFCLFILRCSNELNWTEINWNELN